MSTIEHQFSTPASPDAVYRAVATESGIRAWWCNDCEISEATGGRHELRFVKGDTPVKMGFEVTQLDPGRKVAWKCVSNDNPAWVGSALTWTIERGVEGSTVHFTHGDFADTGPGYTGTVEGWPRFIDSLQRVVLGEPGNPL